MAGERVVSGFPRVDPGIVLAKAVAEE